MRLNSTRLFLTMMSIALGFQSYAGKYQYETIPGDPMKTMIYTLPNGLKVYMSVNKDQPRIQTNIAVKVGSKNDPAETTGLAHYFEHMMFKGTPDFGTTNYAVEKPMLDKIEALFETYRQTTDSTERAALYHQIDSVSYEASKIAIPNEYDKLMATIGANGTNAYTSYDMTCYVEDIPSNELDRWAKIQANRFEKPVLRGFHTELETIYEEKNMSLTKDNRKMTEGMMSALFPNHPYGQWSVLGHQQHLKNPSITNIKQYHKNWYVPNNMAIVMAGDFDPDNAIDIITKYFGHLKPNPNLPVLNLEKEASITTPLKKEVWGNEAEALMLAWRFPGANHPDYETLQIVDYILCNGKAGLIDLDINQKQEALGVSSYIWGLTDYSSYMVSGRPKEGQTLEQLQELMMSEIAKLRNGEFDEKLIPATINNFKLEKQNEIDNNYGRVDRMVSSFIDNVPMERIVTSLDRQSKITKQDVVDFAKKYFRDDNFVAIYKRQGKDTTELKIAKQPITPIVVNRDTTSAFLDAIVAEKVAPIDPVFLDFDRDLTFLTANKNIPVLYKKNESNDVFQLTYVFDRGTYNDKRLSMLNNYFPLLGTPTMSNEQIAQKFYELACNYFISIGNDRSYMVLSGLSENMPKAIALMDDLLNNAIPDKNTFDKVVQRTLKDRENRLKNQQANFNALRSYVWYGPEQLKDMRLTNDELKNVDPKQLTDELKKLNGMEHTIIYYGPMDEKSAIAAIEKNHKTPAKPAKAEKGKKFAQIKPTETVFFVAPYDAKQLYMLEYTTDGKTYDPTIEPLRKMYNEYFGGGMNSIVFQEMRERRSLAYSAWATMAVPSNLEKPYIYMASIATQNDKMADAVEAFDEIIENMPVSQNAFDLAKQGLDARLRSERIIKDNIAWNYLNRKELGEKTDARKEMFEALPSLTLKQVENFQKENVKDRTYYIGILGDPDDIDLDYLRKHGKVVMLTTEDIFGF